MTGHNDDKVRDYTPIPFATIKIPQSVRLEIFMLYV